VPVEASDKVRDPEATADDPIRVTFGVTHTDGNQHVNSLVYPRLFEEAALRRFAATGRSTTVLARKLDIAFRRPSFAGDSVRVVLGMWESAGRIVCTGAFLGEDENDLARARVYVQMAFD